MLLKYSRLVSLKCHLQNFVNGALVTLTITFLNVDSFSQSSTYINENLFRQSDLSRICLSPDGSKVAYVPANWSDNLSIIVRDNNSGEKTQIALSQNEENIKYYIDLLWGTSTRLIFSVGTYQQGPGPIYSINYDGSDFEEIFKSKNSYNEVVIPYILESLPFDSSYILVRALESRSFEKGNIGYQGYYNYLYFTNEYYFIENFYKVNIFNGDRELVYEGREDFNSVAFDKTGEARIGMKYLNGEFKFYYKNKESVWEDIEISVNDSLNFSMIVSAKEFADHHCIILDTDFNDSVFFYASNLLSDKMNLYEYDITNKKSNIIAKANSDYDLVDPLLDFGSSNLLFSYKNKKLIGFNISTDFESTIWLDDNFIQLQNYLDEHFNEKINKIIDWSHDEEIFLVHSYNSEQPGEYYLIDLKEKKVDLLGYYNYYLMEEQLNTTYPISYTSRDGSLIHGYITLPSDSGNRSFPLIVDVHGGPWSRNYYGYNPSAQFFSKNGYAYLQVNFRGSTGFGYKYFIDAKRNFGMLPLQDIVDAVKALINDGMVDSNRVAIMGSSYGGYATLMSLIKYGEVYNCGIDIAGPTDLIKQINSYLPESGRSLSYEFWKDMWGDEIKLALVSPINYCEKIDNPILVIQGEEDKVVKAEQSRNFVSEMESLNKNIEYLELENEGHGGWNFQNNVKIHKEILKFLNSNN